jgi:hypothetical protein
VAKLLYAGRLREFQPGLYMIADQGEALLAELDAAGRR